MPNWKKVVVSGSDAALNNITATGDVTVKGDLIAERYIISSSVSHITQSFSSGSTIFGDTNDDTHQFTGSLLISGNLTLNDGDITINGAGPLTGLTSSYISSSFDDSTNTIDFFKASGVNDQIDLSSIINASGDDDWYLNSGDGYISTSFDVQISGSLHVSGNISTPDLNLLGDSSPEIIADGVLTLSSSQTVIVSSSALIAEGLLFASLSYSNDQTHKAVTYNHVTDQLYASEKGYWSSIKIGAPGLSPSIANTLNATNTSLGNLYIYSGSNNIEISGIDSSPNDSITFDLSNNLSITSLTASSDISSSGTLTAEKVSIDGLSAIYNNNNTVVFGQGDQLPILVNDIQSKGNITSSGNISASGYVYANRYYLNNSAGLSYSGNSLRIGQANWDVIDIGSSDIGTLIEGHLTASKNISASGLLYASTSNAGTNPYLTVLIDTSSGRFYYTGSYGGGGGSDNLGNHTATQDLDMAGFSISAGLNITASGNISASGLLFASLSLDNSTSDGIVHFNTTTNELLYTDNRFYWSNIQIGQGAGTSTVDADTIGDSLVFTTGSNNIEIVNNTLDFIDFDLANNISITTLTASSAISSSGLLFASTSNAGGASYNTLMVDTTTGQFYHTGSYGGGGGSDNLGNHIATQDLDMAGFSISASLNITASGNISASGYLQGTHLYVDDYIYHNGDLNTNIKFNNDQILITAGGNTQAQFGSPENLIGTSSLDLKINGYKIIIESGIVEEPKSHTVLIDDSTGQLYKTSSVAIVPNTASYAFTSSHALYSSHSFTLSGSTENFLVNSDSTYLIKGAGGISIELTEGDSNEFRTTISIDTSSLDTQINNLTSITGSYAVTASNTFTDSQNIQGNITASGNISASGYISASTGRFIGSSDIPTLTLSNIGLVPHIYSPGNLRLESNTGPIYLNQSSSSNVILAEGGGTVAIGTANIPTGPLLYIHGDVSSSGNLNIENHITASGNISASGLLFASTSNASGNLYHTVMVDTASGQFYYTGSYGGGDNLGNHTASLTLVMAGENINMDGGEVQNAAGVYTQVISSVMNGDLTVKADSDIIFKIDADSDETGKTFSFKNNNTEIVSIDESGNITASGDISASGNLLANVTDNSNTGYKTVVYDTATGQFYRTGSYSGGDNLGNHTATQDLDMAGFSISDSLNITASGNISASGIISASNIHGNNLTISEGAYISQFIEFTGVPDGTNFRLDYDAGGLAINQDGISETNTLFSDDSVKFNYPVTASSDISASGLLFASTSDAGGASYNTLMVDTATGQFYHTGSYGSGGGSGTVTSVGGQGTVDGLTLSGTVTTSGSLTLGGAISITTSSITNFPTEVSRSAAAAGFGAGGGGGISFSGTTTNGVVTYGSSTTANVEPYLTFDNYVFEFNAGDATQGSFGFYTDLVNDVEPGSAADIFIGDIVNLGPTLATTAGKIYNLSGSWGLADANDEEKSSYLLGIATTSGQNQNKFMLKGYCSMPGNFFSNTTGVVAGSPIYLDSSTGGTAGQYDFNPPGTGETSRIVGHLAEAYTPGERGNLYKIYFNPSPEWIVL